MKKVIAILFSDLHKHMWEEFNEDNRRLNLGIKALETIHQECEKYGVPALFTGDWVHPMKKIPIELNTACLSTYTRTFEYSKINLYAISGNHDQSQRNNHKKRSPSYLDSFKSVFSTFKLCDYEKYVTRSFVVYGIPYNNGNVDFKPYLKRWRNEKPGIPKILMIHTDLPGAKDTDGRKLGSHEKISKDYSKFFRGFDLVISGHIHRPQQLADNVYMLGAMYQQDRGDRGCDMGYWKLYDNMSLEFIPSEFPEFREYPEGNNIPDDYHFYTPIPKGIKADEEEDQESRSFSSKIAPKKLVKKYLKYKGIKDPEKTQKLIELL